MRWVLVEATGRILPEVDRTWAATRSSQLRERGIDVRLNTRLESCVDGHVVLSDGEEFPSRHPGLDRGRQGQPVLADDRPAGRRQGPGECEADLQVDGHAPTPGRPATAPPSPT